MKLHRRLNCFESNFFSRESMDIFGTHFPSSPTCSITNLVSTMPICDFCRLWFLRFQAMHLRSSYHLEEMMVGADSSNMTPNTFLIKGLHVIQ